jgi:hypothetical protein
MSDRDESSKEVEGRLREVKKAWGQLQSAVVALIPGWIRAVVHFGPKTQATLVSVVCAVIGHIVWPPYTPPEGSQRVNVAKDATHAAGSGDPAAPSRGGVIVLMLNMIDRMDDKSAASDPAAPSLGNPDPDASTPPGTDDPSTGGSSGAGSTPPASGSSPDSGSGSDRDGDRGGGARFNVPGQLAKPPANAPAAAAPPSEPAPAPAEAPPPATPEQSGPEADTGSTGRQPPDWPDCGPRPASGKQVC